MLAAAAIIIDAPSSILLLISVRLMPFLVIIISLPASTAVYINSREVAMTSIPHYARNDARLKKRIRSMRNDQYMKMPA